MDSNFEMSQDAGWPRVKIKERGREIVNSNPPIDIFNKINKLTFTYKKINQREMEMNNLKKHKFMYQILMLILQR